MEKINTENYNASAYLCKYSMWVHIFTDTGITIPATLADYCMEIFESLHSTSMYTKCISDDYDAVEEKQRIFNYPC